MLIQGPDSGTVRPIFVSTADAAKILGLSPWTVKQLIKDEEIESTKHGHRRLVVLASVEAYAKRLREQTA